MAAIAPLNQTLREIACAHCGLPVPRTRIVSEAERQFCCAGCEAVYRIVHECNLEDYYRLRKEYGERSTAPAKVTGKSFEYLDDPDYLKRLGQPRTAGGWLVRFYLDGVHCIACGWLVEKVLLEIEGARFAHLDLGKSVVEIVFNPVEIKLSALARALDRLGYTPHPIMERGEATARRRETRSLLTRLGVAGAAAGNIMLLAVSQYAGDVTGIEREFSALFRWVSLALALPAVLYSAYPFYRGAWNGFRRGVLHMDVPISLGILVAFAISLAATVQNRGEVYYDTVSMLIFLLLAGRLVLQRAGRWAADAGESLLAITPRSVRRIESEGVCEVLLSEIEHGDRLQVLPGDTIPVDGTLDGERAWISEAHLTGEPGAVERKRGETLFAGSVVERAPLEMIATATGEATELSRLAEMVRQASARRAPITGVMDRIASYFVAAVLSLAALTIVVWLFIDPTRALWNAAALMVVACPCALGLATPMALGMAMGRAARRGIFIRGQDGVERLASVNHVILDKTGTLTEGRLTIVREKFAASIADEDAFAIRRAVAALEKYSGHAIATAFEQIATDNMEIEECRVIAGAGIEGRVSAREYLVGTEGFIADRVTYMPDALLKFAAEYAQAGNTLVWIARDREALAVLGLGDRIRDGALAAIEELRRTRLEIELLSGDHPQAVAAVAQELGVTEFRGRVRPEDKLARVEELIGQGKRVAMIGDGVNDAAALSRAGVGISASGSAEVARDAADVFLSSSRGPLSIAETLRLSRRAMRVIRVNLVIALLYNLVGATLAITGQVGPLVAAILMPLSSLTVVLIASRG
ncbi:heavy metal translocating P-type ATPase [bacterium]|nr:heavy metal translocating P-type ATPase [bacterium]MBU1984395.1 heavy metal translocating P-type ATPase [bacterium]